MNINCLAENYMVGHLSRVMWIFAYDKVDNFLTNFFCLGYNNDTWSLYELEGNKGDFFSVHDRPVYIYSSGLGNLVDEADQVGLVYTGSRWFGALYEGLKSVPLEFWVEYNTDFHSFWDKIYDNNTVTLSDPTTDSSPISVDFYIIR